MMWIKAKRILKAGFVNFWRNGMISLATVLVMTMTLFVIGSLLFDRVILLSTLNQIKDKVDISVYFKNDAEEKDILAIKESVSLKNEVKSVEYVSADKALEEFKERHKDNTLIIQSLEEIDKNPLGAVLNIKAKEPSQYESVAKFLEDEANSPAGLIIDKINYFQNKKVIDRLTEIISSAEKSGTIRSVLLMVISILVIFNTIHMAIYNSRDEIGVMRLVGASGRFISGPFIIEGVMYGVISAVISMAVLYPLTRWFGAMFLSGPMTGFVFSQINIFNYYVSNFGQLFLILLFIGIFLGAISSFIAVRRYLKI